jgi:hypothetical protein
MLKSVRYYLFTKLLLLSSFVAFGQGQGVRSGEKELLKVYPNPVVTEANIAINRDLDLERSRVSITFFNIVGKEVFSITNVRDHDVRISREAFLPGMYIFQMRVDDKVLSTGRISFK